MTELLKTKKAVFFDVGYTLDYPASGDWMLTNKFNELAGEKCYKHSKTEIQKAKDKSFEFLRNNHLVMNVQEEYEQFVRFYSELSGFLDLGLTEAERREIAYDRTFNMANYVPYPDVAGILKTLGKTHRLGVISDTWPSIEPQLRSLGILEYFSSATYSCFLGVFKPDRRMYMDSLEKMGLPAEETVFVDDLPHNLAGAAELGITPVLIAADTASDIDVPFLKIHSLKELLQEEIRAR